MSNGEARERVKSLLLEHRGKDDPITSREINDEINIDEIGSFPGTRALIRDIVMEDRIPIAAGNNGYYVIEDEEELEEYVKNLESRVMSITERKMMVQRAAHESEFDYDSDTDLI